MSTRLILFLLLAISAGAQTQIQFSAWFLELPPKMADEIEKQADKADDKSAFYETLLQSPQAEIGALSAPRVLTRPGQSAEIKVGTEHRFLSGTEQDDAGDWLPKFETRDLGISVLVMAAPQPANPMRVTGAFESTISELVSEKEEQISLAERSGLLCRGRASRFGGAMSASTSAISLAYRTCGSCGANHRTASADSAYPAALAARGCSRLDRHLRRCGLRKIARGVCASASRSTSAAPTKALTGTMPQNRNRIAR